MKNTFGKTLVILFLLNLVFFIGTSLFFTDSYLTEKGDGSVPYFRSETSFIEVLSFLAENIEIDEDEIDELDKYPQLLTDDLNNSMFRILSGDYYIPKIILNALHGKGSVLKIHKLHCIYLI
jgi:hypothetical protein